MSSNPTPTPDSGPSATDPLVDLIRTQRQNVAYALIVLALAFLIATVMLSIKANKLSTAPVTDEKDKALKSINLEVSEETPKPRPTQYVFGAMGTALGLVIAGAVGAYLLVSLPKPTEKEQRIEARVVILAVGGLLGAVLMVVGGIYFYLWSESLTNWLSKDQEKQAQWTLYPLLMVLVGGAMIFLATIPARAEERNNTIIRWMVYGSNLGLTTLLVIIILFILNVALWPRLPNKLDTTGTGFYTLSPQTAQLIEGLEQPIHAYAILQEGDFVNEDIKRLLMSCQDANRSKFRVTILSPALNRKDIDKLRADYPMVEMSREGILLVMGEEEGAPERKRYTFLRTDDLADTKMGPGGQMMVVFNGEPKLLRELMYLAENKQRPKIYFTQSSGELAIAPSMRATNQDQRRMATTLKTYLEKNFFDVQPLTFELGAPAKVPDDAAVVVVADPSAPMPPNGVEAIRKYMTEPRPDGKKGKLVVLAGSQSVGRKQLQIGLEPLLTTYGVTLSDRFLYANPVPQLDSYDNSQGVTVLQVGITKGAVDARNPVALGFNKISRLPMVDCRELTAGRPAGFQPLVVIVSVPGRLTWQVSEKPLRSTDALKDIQERLKQIDSLSVPRDQKIKMMKDLETELDMTDESRHLAVFVSEGDAARVAVFGNGWFVSDEASARANRLGAEGATIWLDLMGSTLDWIRDRPTVVGVTEKPYTTYSLKPGYDEFRMVWVPLALALLVVLGIGAGVWVIRRK